MRIGFPLAPRQGPPRTRVGRLSGVELGQLEWLPPGLTLHCCCSGSGTADMELHSSLFFFSLWQETLCAGGVQQHLL